MDVIWNVSSASSDLGQSFLRCFSKYVSQHFNTSSGAVFRFPLPSFEVVTWIVAEFLHILKQIMHVVFL